MQKSSRMKSFQGKVIKILKITRVTTVVVSLFSTTQPTVCDSQCLAGAILKWISVTGPMRLPGMTLIGCDIVEELQVLRLVHLQTVQKKVLRVWHFEERNPVNCACVANAGQLQG